METKGDIMTDKQWEGMIRMILSIMERCPNLEEALKAIRNLLREKDTDNI